MPNLTTLSLDDLSRVSGGADLGSANDVSASSLMARSPLEGRDIGAINPGGQVFENSHAGPSALERVNKSFESSTKLMSSFNETFGAFTQAPGFGNGDVMKP